MDRGAEPRLRSDAPRTDPGWPLTRCRAHETPHTAPSGSIRERRSSETSSTATREATATVNDGGGHAHGPGCGPGSAAPCATMELYDGKR